MNALLPERRSSWDDRDKPEITEVDSFLQALNLADHELQDVIAIATRGSHFQEDRYEPIFQAAYRQEDPDLLSWVVRDAGTTTTYTEGGEFNRTQNQPLIDALQTLPNEVLRDLGNDILRSSYHGDESRTIVGDPEGSSASLGLDLLILSGDREALQSATEDVLILSHCRTNKAARYAAFNAAQHLQDDELIEEAAVEAGKLGSFEFAQYVVKQNDPSLVLEIAKALETAFVRFHTETTYDHTVKSQAPLSFYIASGNQESVEGFVDQYMDSHTRSLFRAVQEFPRYHQGVDLTEIRKRAASTLLRNWPNIADIDERTGIGFYLKPAIEMLKSLREQRELASIMVDGLEDGRYQGLTVAKQIADSRYVTLTRDDQQQIADAAYRRIEQGKVGSGIEIYKLSGLPTTGMDPSIVYSGFKKAIVKGGRDDTQHGLFLLMQIAETGTSIPGLGPNIIQFPKPR